MTARTVIRATGEDRESFLQGLVTNDVAKLSGGLVYAALLTPQGKYLADFFLAPAEDAILIDVSSGLAQDLLRRLSMYKLRSDVAFEETRIGASRGRGTPPEGAFGDPRHPELGWRSYDGREGSDDDWDAVRVAHCVPESGIELIPNESYVLEAGFERLNGVDFSKGCYVGQEVTARMKHKTDLRKGLATVEVEGAAPVGTEIVAGEKPAGALYTQSGGVGIAFLRFDRAGPGMTAGSARVSWNP